jgi:thiamine-phosphate pyrophosphorylase
MTLSLPVICLITDGRLVADGGLARAVAAAVEGGATMVQLREKDLPTRELLELARALRAIVEPKAKLLVNGRVDIAFAAGAAGVHLPSNGVPPAGARQVLGVDALIGQSVHHVDDLRRAELASGLVDYVELGTVFPSRSHPGGACLGLEPVQDAAKVGIPVLGVGGITAENAADVIRAGASGVAVISGILGQADPASATTALWHAVQEAWRQTRPGRGLG